MEVSGQFHTLTTLLPEKGTWSWSGRCGEEKDLCPSRESNPEYSVVQPVAQHRFRRKNDPSSQNQ
jgi:hypothetical protein